ncbi:MAG: Mov34/MPN/PAD-1 family protein [Phycisphaeraceae bacterium]|nr:Mov34/MPN/PAD-1 family protein [Phycisphaeraceae bacterium]
MTNLNLDTAWLNHDAVECMIAEADSKAPNETGGVLMGYFVQPNNTPVILWSGRPGPKAVHLPSYYGPDYVFDELQIADVYQKSGRQLTYIGDWHTHPATVPHLSRRDKRTLRRIATYRAARVTAPIMLILVFDNGWNPVIWQGAICRQIYWRTTLSLTQLPISIF